MKEKNIFDTIDQKIEELSVPLSRDPAIPELKKIAQKNRVRSIEDFLNIDVWSCVKALFYIRSSKYYSFQEVDEMMGKFSSLLDYLRAYK